MNECILKSHPDTNDSIIGSVVSVCLQAIAAAVQHCPKVPIVDARSHFGIEPQKVNLSEASAALGMGRSVKR